MVQDILQAWGGLEYISGPGQMGWGVNHRERGFPSPRRAGAAPGAKAIPGERRHEELGWRDMGGEAGTLRPTECHREAGSWSLHPILPE